MPATTKAEMIGALAELPDEADVLIEPYPADRGWQAPAERIRTLFETTPNHIGFFFDRDSAVSSKPNDGCQRRDRFWRALRASI